MRRGLLIAAALTAGAALAPTALAGGRTEVIVTLRQPPLAEAIASSRALTARVRTARLDTGTPTSRAYLRSLSAAQDAVARRIRRAIPSAQVRWRYQVVVNGLAVVMPTTKLTVLGRVPGVASVAPGVGYMRPRDEASASLIHAPALWGPNFSTIGRGVKIGIIDTGIDQRHPFFDPAGYTMPPGFPKGVRRDTTAKVIVARAFPPPRPRRGRGTTPLPIDEHGTHVAGIAAGDLQTSGPAGRVLSGIAPGAYLGNYRALAYRSIIGPNGNSPEIVKAIESAVKDGMDVINLSIGEPEIEPSRDLVVRAINAAADAGVVPVAVAGNDFRELGDGTIISPGTAEKAITVAATSKSGVIADFSSAGPTPISLELKPDVSAPGESITSSAPPRTWESLSGTSMAAPHVAGAAALLRQRHPDWSVAQIKSALVQTGTPVTDGSREVAPTREGGGLIDLQRADRPLLFASPTGLSFGLVRVNTRASQSVTLTDAGGGAGQWAVRVDLQPGGGAANIQLPSSIAIPGTLTMSVAGTTEGDVTGFIVLTRGSDRRRIPFWARVENPQLGRHDHSVLPHPGVYIGNTAGLPAVVDRYRYPEDPSGVGVPSVLTGPEQVFRFALARRVANFGVHIVQEGPGVRVEPRVVAPSNENRLYGYSALPFVVNDYLPQWQSPVAAAGVLKPKLAAYDVVFDSATPARAGRFRFRFWVNDVRPPTVKLLTHRVRFESVLRLRVTDGGSGVWPPSITASVDGKARKVRYSAARHVATVPVGVLANGRHRLVFRVSDYQETRNDENVARILPNTRVFNARFRVR